MGDHRARPYRRPINPGGDRWRSEPAGFVSRRRGYLDLGLGTGRHGPRIARPEPGLGSLGSAIFAEGGMVSEFIGDAVLAFFGAPVDQPDHADRAVSAALGIDAFARRFSAEQEARGIHFAPSRRYPNRRDRGVAAGRPGSAIRPRPEIHHPSPSDKCGNRAPSRARQTRSVPSEKAGGWRAGSRSEEVFPSPR